MEPPLKPARRPAMTDVAEIAGVSHQTVSRVINDAGKVRPETRDRVLAAIEQLGYRRNELARALATQDTRMISIITTPFSQYGPVSSLFSVQQAAWERGYSVSLGVLSDLSEKTARDTLDRLLGMGTEGIVFVAPVREIARELSRVNVPVPAVTLSTQWTSNSKVVHLGVDQRAGAVAAVTYLLSQGCERIAHIAGPEGWFDGAERHGGFLQALSEAGVQPGPLVSGDWSADSGYIAMKKILDGQKVDAVFVANDQMALGALRAAEESGVSVPRDMRLIGFDDEPGSAYFSPPLTTVRQDFAELGRNAMLSLSKMISGQRVESALLEPTLIVRETA